ncbi:MAG: DUF721 domain-containing protein [Phycisphaeraceae bacterium]|nr:DUF721 domain-containing protein [Phycisphaeraceae bacterium]
MHSPAPPDPPESPDPRQQYLDRLRQWRNRKEADLSLEKVTRNMGKQLERLQKQMGPMAELWEQIVPPSLLPFTRLEGFARGVLTVGVQGSSRLFELDRFLRQGKERELIQRFKAGSLRRVKLQLAAVDAPNDLPAS